MTAQGGAKYQTWVERKKGGMLPWPRWGWAAVAQLDPAYSRWFLPPTGEVWCRTREEAIRAIPEAVEKMRQDIAWRERLAREKGGREYIPVRET